MEPSGLAKQLVKAKLMNDAAAAAREVAETPTARLARELSGSPTVKNATKVTKSPTAKLVRKISESPNLQAAAKAAETPTAKLARKLSESPTAAAKKTAILGDDLAALRRRLGVDAAAAAKAKTSPFSVAELSPQLRAALSAKYPAPAPILPGPPPRAPLPEVQKIDTDKLFRRAKEIFTEDAEEKRELDLKMVATMEAMHAALVEANQRETEALGRAKAAEDREAAAQERTEERERRMVKLTVWAVVIAAMSLAATAGTIIVALSAS